MYAIDSFKLLQSLPLAVAIATPGGRVFRFDWLILRIVTFHICIHRASLRVFIMCVLCSMVHLRALHKQINQFAFHQVLAC